MGEIIQTLAKSQMLMEGWRGMEKDRDDGDRWRGMRRLGPHSLTDMDV